MVGRPYLGDGRVGGEYPAYDGGQVDRPERQLRLPVVELDARIEGRVQVQVAQLALGGHFEVYAQDSRTGWISGDKNHLN